MKRQFQAFSYRVVNKAEDTLDVFIDGIIVDAETQEILKSWFGDETSVSYKSFRDQILDAKPKVINVHINSAGGMVTDAMAIHDFMIDQTKNGVTVNTIGRGIVASAATYVLMAGGKNSSMSENSWFMIHNVSGGIWGDVDMVENYARSMRKFNDSVVNFYAKATGLSETVVGNMMTKETWMTAAEAKEKGFINDVTGKENFSNAIKQEHWPFDNTAILNTYNEQVKAPDSHTSFLTEIKNDFMQILDEFKNAIGGGKSNKKFDNIKERDAILDMVQEVLTPVINKIDEALAEDETTEEKPAEKKPEVKAEEKKTENKTDQKEGDEEGEDEVDELTTLKNELQALKDAYANQVSQPPVNNGKSTKNVGKFEYETE